MNKQFYEWLVNDLPWLIETGATQLLSCTIGELYEIFKQQP